jgi:hypothetical protein
MKSENIRADAGAAAVRLKFKLRGHHSRALQSELQDSVRTHSCVVQRCVSISKKGRAEFAWYTFAQACTVLKGSRLRKNLRIA